MLSLAEHHATSYTTPGDATDLQRREASQTEQLLLPTDLQNMPVAAGLEDVQLSEPVTEVPVPGNRAERRAAQHKHQ